MSMSPMLMRTVTVFEWFVLFLSPRGSGTNSNGFVGKAQWYYGIRKWYIVNDDESRGIDRLEAMNNIIFKVIFGQHVASICSDVVFEKISSFECRFGSSRIHYYSKNKLNIYSCDEQMTM